MTPKSGIDPLRDRRLVVFAGMGLALAGGLLIAFLLLSRDPGSAEAPPASQGGLVVQTGRDDDAKLDERHPLKCFVGGQLVGDLPLSDCARKNGVASGALDVGLDQNGALAAASGASPQITPLPPQSAPATPAPGEADSDDIAAPDSARPIRLAPCWRYGAAEWTRLPDEIPLGVCVQDLYADQCQRDGPPLYGRWGDRTLRLLQGRIEISPDNRNFHVLATRNPGCPS